MSEFINDYIVDNEYYNNLFQNAVAEYKKTFGECEPGKILNGKNINEDLEIINNHKIRGINEENALYEIHIFLNPVWMSPDEIDKNIINKYTFLCSLFNNIFKDKYKYFKNMGSPVLSLIFTKETEDLEVTVLQSSLYYSSNDFNNVVNLTHKLAIMFSLCGFEVIREKIEVMTYGIEGLPSDINDIENDKNYYEYHIRVMKKNTDIDNNKIAINSEEYNELLSLKNNIANIYKLKVPLSFNRTNDSLNNPEKQYQRYINLRFRNISNDAINIIINQIIEYINSSSSLKVAKTHREYIVYDSFTDLDNGWIQ